MSTQSTYTSQPAPAVFIFMWQMCTQSLQKEMNLYGRKAVSFNTPFHYLHNGTEEQPDKRELRLSDTFQVKEEELQLELKATMLEHQQRTQQKKSWTPAGP